jgi:hypothetical protein
VATLLGGLVLGGNVLTVGHVRRAAFAGLISVVMLATAGVASAQEEASTDSSATTSTQSSVPELPAEQAPVPAVEESTSTSPDPTSETATEAPAPPARPLVSVLADCYDGFKSLGVWVDGADGVTYEVTLAPEGGSGDAVTRTTEAGDDGLQRVFFDGPRPGTYVVTVVGADGSEGGSEVTVEKCSTLEPDAPMLSADVRCVDDQGTVVIRVANPGTGEVRTFSVDVDGLTLWDGLRLSGGFFVDIVEQAFEDGTYTIALYDVDDREHPVASDEIVVACAPVVPSTTAPATTTTPAPQGGSAPSGGLATTGAAVGGLAVLGIVVLGLGVGLVLVGRRRRDVTPE